MEFYKTTNQYEVTCTHDTLSEAMKLFVGYDGYRLDLFGDGNTISIFRDELPLLLRDDGTEAIIIETDIHSVKEYNASILLSTQKKG